MESTYRGRGRHRFRAAASLVAFVLLPGALRAGVTTLDVVRLAGTGRIVTFGQVFKPGDVADGVAARVKGADLPTQVDVKRRHPDGSVRHAVVSVRLPESGAARLDLVPAPSATGGGLAVSEALNGGFDAVVEISQGGATYRASAAELLREGGAERWLDGPLVTELHVQGAPRSNASTHPGLLVGFDVRFLSADDVRVQVTVENTWPSAADQSYGLVVAVGGRTVLAETSVRQPHHTRWMRSFATGDVGTFHVDHDLPYLVATGAAPSYDLGSEPSGSQLQSWYDDWRAARLPGQQRTGTFDLLGYGVIQPSFVSADEGEPLPWWAAQALLSGDRRPLEITLDAGERAGHFAVHYRSPKTGRVLTVDEAPDFPRVVEDAVRDGSGKVISDADDAHQQSMAWLPYVLTGDRYFWEETQFWVAYNVLSRPPGKDYRNGAEGLLRGGMVRSQAWSMRTLGHAAWIAPTADAPYLERMLLANLRFYDRTFVDPKGPGHNPFGILDTGPISRSQKGMEDVAADATARQSSWNHDVFAWVADYLVGLGYPAEPLRDFLLRNLEGRLGNHPGFWRYDAFNGQHAAKGADGSFYPDWPAMWRATFSSRPESEKETTFVRFGWKGCVYCYWQHGRAGILAAVAADMPWASAALDEVDADFAVNVTGSMSSRPSWALVARKPSSGPKNPANAKPASPKGLRTTFVGDREIDLAWDGVAGAESIVVDRAAGSAGFAKAAELDGRARAARVTGLSPHTEYRFRLRARNGAGSSDASTTLVVTTAGSEAPPPPPPPPPAPPGPDPGPAPDPEPNPDPTPSTAPEAPGTVSARALAPTRVAVTWADDSTNETEFRVEGRSTGAFAVVAKVGAGRTSVTLEGLASGVRHAFRVAACNAIGCSDFAAATSVVTPEPAGEDERWLSAAAVACDARRLEGFFARMQVAADGGKPTGVNLSLTATGDLFGIARTGNGPSTPEHHLAFSTNPEETTLLRNPARPQLASVSLARNDLNSDLVDPGDPDELWVVLDPTLDGRGEAGSSLAIANLAGRSSSARPGRGLDGLVEACHREHGEVDVAMFRLLAKTVRGRAAGAATLGIAIYRDRDPRVFRIDLYPRRADGTRLGRLAAELEVTRDGEGVPTAGVLRVRDGCRTADEVGCTTAGSGIELSLSPPVPAGEFLGATPFRVDAGDPERLVDFGILLAGTTWSVAAPDTLRLGNADPSLAPEAVRCEGSRLAGFLDRIRLEAPAGTVAGINLGTTARGDLAGVAFAAAGAGAPDSLLAFSANPEEMPLLRNPERLPLLTVSFTRNALASDLVAGAAGELRLRLDPTLDNDGTGNAQLTVDNRADRDGGDTSARPGRGLDALLAPCHGTVARRDVHVLRVLSRLLRVAADGAEVVEAAIYRGPSPATYRIDAYPIDARGRRLGRVAAELAVTFGAEDALIGGELRLRPACGEVDEPGCTSLGSGAELALVAPVGPGAQGESSVVAVRSAAAGATVERAEVDWSRLLAGSTWRHPL